MDEFGGGYDDYGGGGMDNSGGGMYVCGEGIPMDNFSGGMDVGYGMNYSGGYNQNVGFSGSEVIGGDLNDENEDMGTDTVSYVNEISDDEPDEIEDNEEEEDGDDDGDEEGDDDDDEDDDSKPPKAPKMKKTKMPNKPKKSKQNQSKSPKTKQVQTRAVHKPNTTITFKKYYPNEPTVAKPVYKKTVPKPKQISAVSTHTKIEDFPKFYPNEPTRVKPIPATNHRRTVTGSNEQSSNQTHIDSKAAPKQKEMSPLCLALLFCAPFMFVVVLAGGIYTALHFTVLKYSEGGDEDGQ